MSPRPHCRCTVSAPPHPHRRVVLTGGPGAGKTAALEIARQELCAHVVVLPEAATIIFGGGFPRRPEAPARKHAQLAIFHVQDQMERLELALARAALVICDRGVPDGAAYWPGDDASFWAAVGATRESVIARYDAVIHMRSPPENGGYGHQNPVRRETAAEARAIDERIARVWDGHPNRVFVGPTDDFLDKVRTTLAHLEAQLPECCRRL